MGPSFDDDEIDSDPALALASSEEGGLRDLEARLGKLKEPAGGNKLFARGVGLVTSLGFVLAGCLIAGLFAGQYASARFGSPAFTIVGLLLGLVAAIFACVKLLGPFLKSGE